MAALVGRARELAAIDRLLADASEGVGGLLLVSGPAGIGKTRLADAAVERAERRDMQVRRGGAMDDAGAPSLWPWHGPLVGRSGQNWTAPAVDEDDAAATFRLLVELTRRLTEEAAEHPMLVVLEDFHWADRISVRLLRHVAAELRTSRMAIVVTARPGDGELAAALPELARGESFRALELMGLTAAEVTAWLPFLTDRPDAALAEAVWQATGGNPLFVRLIAAEMAGSTRRIGELLESRPQLRQMIAGRVAALPSSAQEVIEAASVLGQHLDPSVVGTVVGHDVDAELELIRKAGILRGFEFDHALVRDAVYAGLSVTSRIRLHRAAAAALERQPQPQPGVIAMHWQQAGAAAECLPWAVRAYHAARELPAYDDAVRWAEIVVSCARTAEAEVTEPLLCLAQALTLAGYFERAANACLEAAAAAEDAGRHDLLAAAALVVQGVGNSDLHHQLMPLYNRALTVVPAHDHATRARVMAQHAVAVAEIEGGSGCAELAAGALAEAERSRDPSALIDAVAARHLSITVPDTVTERRALADRAVELGRTADRPIAALWGHLWRAQAAVQLGDMDDAHRHLAELDRIAGHRGFPLARWHYLRHLAARQAQVGDFSAARQSNADADRLALQMGDLSMRGMTFAFLSNSPCSVATPTRSPQRWSASSPPHRRCR